MPGRRAARSRRGRPSGRRSGAGVALVAPEPRHRVVGGRAAGDAGRTQRPWSTAFCTDSSRTGPSREPARVAGAVADRQIAGSAGPPLRSTTIPSWTGRPARPPDRRSAAPRSRPRRGRPGAAARRSPRRPPRGHPRPVRATPAPSSSLAPQPIPVGEEPGHLGRDRPAHRPLRRLDDVDLLAELAGDGGELEADEPGPDHHDLPDGGDPRLQVTCLGERAQVEDAVEVRPRHRQRPVARAGRQHEVVEADLRTQVSRTRRVARSIAATRSPARRSIPFLA